MIVYFEVFRNFRNVILHRQLTCSLAISVGARCRVYSNRRAMGDFKWDTHAGLFYRSLFPPGLPKQYTGADTSRVGTAMRKKCFRGCRAVTPLGANGSRQTQRSVRILIPSVTIHVACYRYYVAVLASKLARICFAPWTEYGSKDYLCSTCMYGAQLAQMCASFIVTWLCPGGKILL